MESKENGIAQIRSISGIAGNVEDLLNCHSPISAEYKPEITEKIDIVTIQSPRSLRYSSDKRLLFSEIPHLSFDAQVMLTGIITGDYSDPHIAKIFYPHFRPLIIHGHFFGDAVQSRSLFTTNHETAGKILSSCCEALELNLEDIREIINYVGVNRTWAEDQPFEELINRKEIKPILQKAEDFKKGS